MWWNFVYPEGNLLCKKMQRAVHSTNSNLCTSMQLEPAPVNLHFHGREFSFFKLNRMFLVINKQITFIYSQEVMGLWFSLYVHKTLSWKSFVVILCLECVCTHTQYALHKKTNTKIHHFVVWDFRLQTDAYQISSSFWYWSSRQWHTGQEANYHRHRHY